MKPSETSRRLQRIAAALDRAERPSLSKLAAEIGRVTLALEEDAGVESQPSPEGELAVPVGQMIAHLNSWLTAKYTIDAAYRSFADRVKGPWRDSLVAHWQEHAKEERAAAYDLAMRISGLGGDPAQTVITVPECPSNLRAFCVVLMDLEVKAIAKAHETIAMSGSLRSLGVLAENLMLVDTQHLDDLRRMIPKD
jgi:bacterioferritin (cytochrome b1)